MAWDPAQYGLFEAARARPGHDLMAALPPLKPATVVDLGCGAGKLTMALANRYSVAEVAGVDSSAAMLGRAALLDTRVAWQLGDIRHWRPAAPVHLLFSNAALQWVEGHGEIFPQLLSYVAPGGVMAVQMPRNFTSPSHALLRQVAADGPWAGLLEGRLREAPVHEPAQYYDWLVPGAAHVDVWETEYLHVLDGPDPVLEWTKATAMLPVLETLTGAMLADFIERYRAALAAAYPRRVDGRTLFPFRRLFIVATRA
ncbi:methyltransferase domain-containing protein [Nitrospirillum iridis]|uniref:Trans-aconitate 2-methyltransferase n=1 Tax=Nitrospirillum iridis TaxID=765888 RepID=A0A7X0AYC9_9PROT|nr:methyltransferase domain-containing protein [Nitrospirillum iridis]MBB6252412.1 trans-aconitate 2-methyltransferase [Nitrospirillum iridis]